MKIEIKRDDKNRYCIFRDGHYLKCCWYIDDIKNILFDLIEDEFRVEFSDILE